MKKMISLFVCLVLVLSLFLTACSSEEKQADGDTKGTVQNSGAQDQEKSSRLTGRYAEQTVDFPEKIRTVFDFECGENGTIKILIENDPGSLWLYESKDAGITWQKNEGISAELFPENYGTKSACFGPGESIFVSAGEMIVNEYSENQITGEFIYYELSEAEGGIQANELKLELPEPEDSFLKAGYGLSSLAASDSGYIYGTVGTAGGNDAFYSAYKLICADKNSGRIVWSLDVASDDFTLAGDEIYLMEYKKSGSSMSTLEDISVRMLNADTGEENGEYEFQQGISNLDCVDFDAVNEKMYYCTESGIYGTDDKNTLTEQLVDGSICSISSIEYTLRNFYAVNESVFILLMRPQSAYDGLKLLRYEYDPDLITLPENELTIYSLKENNTVKKLISDFRLQHPDVYVKYEIGMLGAGAKTVSDAISLLNTEIIAGNGPDVLILNGLPWESYQEKGILEDLSGELDSFIEEDQVFQNIFSVYRQDDSQYVVPAAFRIPVVVGSRELTGSIETWDDLIEEAAASVENTGYMMPFSRRDEDLLRYMVSVNWQSIQNEDGTISKEELRNILKDSKELNDIIYRYIEKSNDETELPKDYDAFSNDCWLSTQGLYVYAMDIGYLSTLRDYVDLYNGVDLYNSDLGYRVISKNVFTSLLAGVNGEADSKDLAKEFIRFMISEEEQEILFDEMYGTIMYLPVNKDAFHNMIQKPDEERLNELGKGYAILGLPYNWPEESWFQQLEGIIEGLTIPAMEDSVAMEAVMEYGMPYVNGEKDVNTAVGELVQKLELYLAE